MLPAPKNMEKSARPITRMSDIRDCLMNKSPFDCEYFVFNRVIIVPLTGRIYIKFWELFIIAVAIRQ